MQTITDTGLSPPLRILMLCPQYRPLVGGYERAAERLSAALVVRGHQVTVIAERRDARWPKQETIDGVSVRRLWCLYRPRFHIMTTLFSFALYLLTRGRRFEVWHVHQYGLVAALAIALGNVLGRPVVLKLSSTEDYGLAQAAKSGRFTALLSYLFKRVAAIVTTTRETTSEAIAFGIPAERIHCLGNGVDTADFCPRDEQARAELKQQLGLGTCRVVLYVGRLSEEKNPDGLLQAWIMALPSLPVNWKLVLVGDGAMRDALDAMLSEHGLENKVVLAGQQRNIEQWLGSVDIYVLSSRIEGLSNSLLEAMASGLPVVATRVSGVGELVEESGAGLGVAVGDMTGVAKALARLASDPGLRLRMGTVGRQVIVGRYAITAVAGQHEALYRQLLAVGSH